MATNSVSVIPVPVPSSLTDGEAASLDLEIKLYVQLRNNREAVDKVLKALKQREEDQRNRLIDVMEAQNIKTVNHDLGRVTRVEKLKAAIVDTKALRESLAEEGLLQEMLRTEWAKANLNRLVKERLETGEQPPTGVEAVTERSITLTRPKA